MPESANEHLAQLEQMIRANPPSAILDVGMGRGNYGWYLRNQIGYAGKLYGIDVWAPYISGPNALAGGNLTYYDRVEVVDVRQASALMAELRPDIIFAFDVVEHLVRDEGVLALRSMQRAALRSVLVSLPIVPYPQGEIHGNPHETHRYDWTVREMVALGSEFRHRGQVTGLFEFPGGGLDRLVTVMLNTVREADLAGRDVLRSLAADLRAQTFKEFELVVVDGLHSWRSEAFAEHDYPFRTLHVPPRDTPMVRDRRCAISAYKNTGLAHARGQLVVTVDDCCSFDERFVERYWETWSRDHAMLSALYMGHDSVNIIDSRAVFVAGQERCVGPIGGDPATPPMYGFASIPIEAAIAVNGYDELMDGSRGLEDMDMGIRLQQAGYRIALDKSHVVRLFPQGSWSEKVFGDRIASGEDRTCVKCCHTSFLIQRDRNLARANESAWGDAEWKKIAPRCHLLTAESRCSLNGHPCPYVGTCSDREHPGLEALRREPPSFDLRELRTASGIR